jgi:hypothetical protein
VLDGIKGEWQDYDLLGKTITRKICDGLVDVLGLFDISLILFGHLFYINSENYPTTIQTASSRKSAVPKRIS